jgi:hypothetical protein
MCRWYRSNLPNGTSTQSPTTSAGRNYETTGYFRARTWNNMNAAFTLWGPVLGMPA